MPSCPERETRCFFLHTWTPWTPAGESSRSWMGTRSGPTGPPYWEGIARAGLTIILEALASIQESGVPHRPVEVVFTRHEEGGLVGVHHLDFSLVDAKMGVVFDGEGPVSRITVAAPSQNVVKANITGRAAHAGVEPEKGLSAILIASEIITRLPLGRIDAETTSNIGRMDAWSKAQHRSGSSIPGRRNSQPGQRQAGPG